MQKSWKLPFAVAFLLATVPLHAQSASPSAEAKALATVMKVGEQMREGLLFGIQKAIQQGRASQKEYDCMKSSSLVSLEDTYATAFGAALSPDELKDAAAFLSTPHGKEYLRYARSLERKQRGLPDPDPKPELTDKETAATLKFLEKSAGKKLLETRAFETAEFRSSLVARVSELVIKCKA